MFSLVRDTGTTPMADQTYFKDYWTESISLVQRRTAPLPQSYLENIFAQCLSNGSSQERGDPFLGCRLSDRASIPEHFGLIHYKNNAEDVRMFVSNSSPRRGFKRLPVIAYRMLFSTYGHRKFKSPKDDAGCKYWHSPIPPLNLAFTCPWSISIVDNHREDVCLFAAFVQIIEHDNYAYGQWERPSPACV